MPKGVPENRWKRCLKRTNKNFSLCTWLLHPKSRKKRGLKPLKDITKEQLKKR